MRLACWNVNSVRARLERVQAWLKSRQPDLLALQELKCTADAFPTEAFEELGYRSAVHGQKTYNGVALLARAELEDIETGMDGDDPPQARLIAATWRGIRVVCVYVPNGQSPESEKFTYKLSWLDRLCEWIAERHQPSDPLIVMGDFNIAPEDRDVHDPDAWRGQVHFHPQEHARLARLHDFGLVDLFRQHHPEPGLYSWWDYRQLAFPRNAGLRIDLALATPSVARRCTDCRIDREERKGKQPSDHAPLLIELDEAPTR